MLFRLRPRLGLLLACGGSLDVFRHDRPTNSDGGKLAGGFFLLPPGSPAAFLVVLGLICRAVRGRSGFRHLSPLLRHFHGLVLSQRRQGAPLPAVPGPGGLRRQTMASRGRGSKRGAVYPRHLRRNLREGLRAGIIPDRRERRREMPTILESRSSAQLWGGNNRSREVVRRRSLSLILISE